MDLYRAPRPLPRMTAEGHEDPFPWPRRNGRCRFRKRSSAADARLLRLPHLRHERRPGGRLGRSLESELKDLRPADTGACSMHREQKARPPEVTTTRRFGPGRLTGAASSRRLPPFASRGPVQSHSRSPRATTRARPKADAPAARPRRIFRRTAPTRALL